MVSSHDEMFVVFDKMALDVFMGNIHKFQRALLVTKCQALHLDVFTWFMELATIENEGFCMIIAYVLIR